MKNCSTIYGVDLKITPDGMPRLIELNGVDSGTDFFKMPDQGERFYRSVMRELGRAAKGRPIYLETELCNDRSEQCGRFLKREYRVRERQEMIKKKALRKQQEEDEREIRAIRKKQNGCTRRDVPQKKPPLLQFEREWIARYITDQNVFASEPDCDAGYPPEASFYAAAGRREGLDVRLFERMYRQDPDYTIVAVEREGNFGRQFRDVRYEMRTMRKNDGLAWARHRTLADVTHWCGKPGRTFVNSSSLEQILHHKGALYAYLANSPVLALGNGRGVYGISFPKTFVYLPGVTRTESLTGFLQELSGDLAVLKPPEESHGVGTRIIRRDKLLRRVSQTRPDSIDPRAFYGAGLNDMLKYAFVVQEFVPSKPVIAERDNKPHDGCVRGIVIDGKWAGGQWRLAPMPMNGNGSYVSRYRCNLSRGAFAQNLSGKDEETAAGFAEAAVNAFETATEPILRSPVDFAWCSLPMYFQLSDEHTQQAVIDAVIGEAGRWRFDRDKRSMVKK